MFPRKSENHLKKKDLKNQIFTLNDGTFGALNKCYDFKFV